MRIAVVAVLAALAGGAAGGAIVAALDDDDAGRTQTVVREPAAATGSDAARSGEGEGDGGLTPAAIYRRDAPGVVFIEAEVVQRTESPFFPAPLEQRGSATGTGFVIDDDGTIVTNAHVVADATRVTVKFSNQKKVPAKVRGSDESTDLAVLRVDPKGLDLAPLELGSSRGVEVGDPTVAIGNPFGLEQTLTTGVISAKQRRIDAPNGFTISDVLQTDAAINPGNSGGPLIDAAGRVIGVNSAIRTSGAGQGSIGIGFAIPIDTVKRVVPDLLRDGRVDRAYLGVSSATAQGGAVVTAVEPGSPAEEAGLRPGDLLTSVDGRTIAAMEDVRAAVDSRRPGDAVEVVFTRAGDEQRVRVELAERPANLVG